MPTPRRTAHVHPRRAAGPAAQNHERCPEQPLQQPAERQGPLQAVAAQDDGGGSDDGDGGDDDGEDWVLKDGGVAALASADQQQGQPSSLEVSLMMAAMADCVSRQTEVTVSAESTLLARTVLSAWEDGQH